MNILSRPWLSCRIWSRHGNKTTFSWPKYAIFAPRLFGNWINKSGLDIWPGSWSLGISDVLYLFVKSLLTGSESNVLSTLNLILISLTFLQSYTLFIIIIIGPWSQGYILTFFIRRVNKTFYCWSKILKTLWLSFNFKSTFLCILSRTWPNIRVIITFNQVLNATCALLINLRR